VGQASLLSLYDSQRLKQPLKSGSPTRWDQADREITERLNVIRTNGGAVRLLTGTVNSPTLRASIAAFLKPQLVVLDAVRILTANGPTGGNLADVKRKDTIIAGVDQVAVDAYGATLLGLKPTDIACCTEGQARGLGTMNYQSLSPAMLEI
jgi:vacuolar-type H+-ATPase catalytic subunit A/Vma1